MCPDVAGWRRPGKGYCSGSASTHSNASNHGSGSSAGTLPITPFLSGQSSPYMFHSQPSTLQKTQKLSGDPLIPEQIRACPSVRPQFSGGVEQSSTAVTSSVATATSCPSLDASGLALPSLLMVPSVEPSSLLSTQSAFGPTVVVSWGSSPESPAECRLPVLSQPAIVMARAMRKTIRVMLHPRERETVLGVSSTHRLTQGSPVSRDNTKLMLFLLTRE